MDVENGLQKLGLTEKQAQAYLFLVRSGPSSAARISKTTEINRRAVYDLLDSLISLGLVNYLIVERKKVFQPTPLDSLSAMIEEKQNIAKSLQSELGKSFLRSQKGPKIEIFSGKKSMKGIFERQLDIEETVHIYGGSMPARHFLETYYPQWTNKRAKKGIRIKGIFIDSPEVKKYVKSLPLISYKFIPKEFLSPAFWWLQGNVVYLVFFQETPLVISIESKEMAKTYLNSFNLLWKNL